jgi:DNA repair protein RecO (recombination protein O)
MINLDGIVIAERDCGETSKSVTLLTKELACIEVYVRGGRKSKKSVSSTQLFCYAKFSLEEKRDAHGAARYYYNSSEPIKLFYNIRLDAKKTALACYFAEMLMFGTVSGDNIDEVMRLTLNTFYFLDKGDRSIELLKSIFEFRLLCETGYRPNFIGCCHCYAVEDDTMHFNLKSGLIECDNCVTNRDSYYDVTFDKTLFHIVRFIALVDFDRLFNFRISDIYQRKLTAFTERFCQYYYGRKFETLKFYNLL